MALATIKCGEQQMITAGASMEMILIKECDYYLLWQLTDRMFFVCSLFHFLFYFHLKMLQFSFLHDKDFTEAHAIMFQ